MGTYLNPPLMKKRDWLDRNAIFQQRLPPPTSTFALHEKRGQRWVRWVNNGPFDAAGVMYCLEELEMCIREIEGGDVRPTHWYLVPRVSIAAILDPSVIESGRY